MEIVNDIVLFQTFISFQLYLPPRYVHSDLFVLSVQWFTQTNTISQTSTVLGYVRLYNKILTVKERT